MHRYRIADLDIEGTPVIWTMASGDDAEGYLTITARGRRVYRVYTDSPRRRQSADLPSFSAPALWRPLFPDRWPDVLPEPAVVLEPIFDARHRPQPSPAIETIGEPDGWPYPDLVLTLGTPKSIEEAEARVLRGLRTQQVLERLDERPHGDTLWPPALMFKARMVAKALKSSRTGQLGFLRREDYSDIHVDRSDLRALPDVWIPTRRDVGDVENGVLTWLRDLTEGQARIVHMRAAMPQYSWRAIAEFRRHSVEHAKTVYGSALEWIWRRAVV